MQFPWRESRGAFVRITARCACPSCLCGKWLRDWDGSTDSPSRAATVMVSTGGKMKDGCLNRGIFLLAAGGEIPVCSHRETNKQDRSDETGSPHCGELKALGSQPRAVWLLYRGFDYRPLVKGGQ